MLISRLQWHLLLEPTIPSLSSSSTYSREVQLLLERKRLSTWGITSYDLHKASGKIVFPASSTLYQCLDTGYNVNKALLFLYQYNYVFLFRSRHSFRPNCEYVNSGPLSIHRCVRATRI